ncbi:PREDICTED: interleukin-1 receptor type 2 isoform X1 [Myotis brandtii]|uniref:interleukin-1 receptor type 2 isoform X1 n=1 Tax=Myotis brandtii TaxID=109478 RepID=UPI00070407A9|nr:PREDICTED: interleukin-1 receptor type 2 isoform X1 [Myotis brandtii]
MPLWLARLRASSQRGGHQPQSPVLCRLNESIRIPWLQSAGPQTRSPWGLWTLLEMMLTLYLLMMGVSAFTIQPEERTVAAGSCQDRGKHFKTSLKVEGEPVVLRCPQARYWLGATASPRGTVTWRKSGSARPAPGEDGRVWVQDGDLWILPAQRGDSGTYLCTVRNASYCDQMALDLRVLENTDASLPAVSYPQVLTVAASGSLVCPELSEFAKNKTDLKIQWYKDSVLLDQDSGKFLSVRGTTRLLIRDVSVEDAGRYSCVMAFAHGGTRYNVTRNIKLRVHRKEVETVPVMLSPHQTISASLGSRLTVPCKVFLGGGAHSTTLLWWMANATSIDTAYQAGRVREGPRLEYSENDANYIEVPLIFDPVIREDLTTDFKCVVHNTLSFQMLHTTVKEATTFSWGIALAPLSLVFLVLGGIWMRRRHRHRTGKAYGLTTLKTGHQDVQSYSSKIKEVK